MNYTFPFSTCESRVTIKGHPSQPFSALINFVSVCILFGLCFVKRKPVILPLTIASYMVLEAWHGYSHAIHIKNTDLQFIIIHCINYLAVFMTMLCVQLLTKKNMWIEWLILVAAFITELVFFIKRKKDQYSVIGGTLLFLLVGILSFRHLPKNSQKFAISAGIIFIIGIVFFVLEFLYCQSWMKKFEFPYHIIIELLTMVFLILVSLTLIKIKNF
jgi:hypothetical protein